MPNEKKLENLKRVIENGGNTKDLVMFDMLVEELSSILGTSTDSITEAIQKLQDREEKETIVNVEAPVVNVPAPIVNVKAPDVTVEAPEVHMDMEEMCSYLEKIIERLDSQEPFNLEKSLEKFIKEDRIKVNVDRVGSGVGGVVTFPIVDAMAKGFYLTGQTSANGTRELTSANTWYAVPSTVPTAPYELVVTQENASGTIRWGFSNSGTPSATNGNQAPSELRVRLAGSQVVYFASSTASDDVNWTTRTL